MTCSVFKFFYSWILLFSYLLCSSDSAPTRSDYDRCSFAVSTGGDDLNFVFEKNNSPNNIRPGQGIWPQILTAAGAFCSHAEFPAFERCVAVLADTTFKCVGPAASDGTLRTAADEHLAHFLGGLIANNINDAQKAYDTYFRHLGHRHFGHLRTETALEFMFHVRDSSLLSLMPNNESSTHDQVFLRLFELVANFELADQTKYFDALMVFQTLVLQTLGDDPGSSGELFRHFGHDPLFAFLTPRNSYPCDEEALARAHALDISLAEALLLVGDSPVGSSPSLLAYFHPLPSRPTMNTSRHIFLLALLEAALKSSGHPRTLALGNLRVLEIGGGYGNIVRLVHGAFGFAHWTLIDVPLISKLQQWYLQKTIGGGACIIRFGSDSTLRTTQNDLCSQAQASEQSFDACGFKAPLPKRPLVRVVANSHVSQFAARVYTNCGLGYELGSPDVLIGTHSWSEMPLDQFYLYFNYFVINGHAAFILYSYQHSWPLSTDNLEKRAMLEKWFRTVSEIESEGGKVVNLVMQRRVQLKSEPT